MTDITKELNKQGISSSKVVDESHTIGMYQGLNSHGNQLLIRTSKDDSTRSATFIHNGYEAGKLVLWSSAIKQIELNKFTHGKPFLICETKLNLLSQTRPDEKWEVSRLMNFAISACDGLSRIHQGNLVHGNIDTNTVLFDPDYLKCVEFWGLEWAAPPEAQRAHAMPSLDERNLSNLAPEQTGRLRLQVDQRTDIYALGALLYQLATGRSAIYGEDPLEILHAIIARNPTPVEIVNPEIPDIVSKLIMKMLEKSPSDRYQTVNGVKSDLERILEKIEAPTGLTSFNLAQYDTPTEFRIPDTLYGREEEQKVLLRALEKAQNQQSKQLVNISGASGIGKSSLTSSLYQSVTEVHGRFLSGKFDQYNQNNILSAFNTAVNQFLREVLTENHEQFEFWKSRIAAAVHPHQNFLFEFVPNLRLIIDETSESNKENISPEARQNLTISTYVSLIKAMSIPNMPTVFFFDDVQWIDPTSIELLKTLLVGLGTGSEGSQLFICAYRDNEVDRSHQYISFLNEIKSLKIETSHIVLEALPINALNAMISESLGRPSHEVTGLTEAVERKTHGNPFYTRRYLFHLVDQKILRQDETGQWSWDINSIEKDKSPEEVANFLAQQMNHLDKVALVTLQLVSSLGQSFDARVAARVLKYQISDFIKRIHTTVARGYIEAAPDHQKAYSLGDKLDETVANELDLTYSFVHDKVQQAAYSMLSDDLKLQSHHDIGTYLLNQWLDDPQSMSSEIFVVMGHLHQALPIIQNSQIRRATATIAMHTASRAIDARDFKTALSYAKTGIDILDEENLVNDEHFELSCLYANAHQYSGNIEIALERLKSLLNLDLSVKQKLRVLSDIIKILMGPNDPSIKDYLTMALECLGFKIPNRPAIFDVLGIISNGKKLMEVPKFNENPNPELESVITSISLAIPTLYQTDRDYLARAVNLAMKMMVENRVLCDMSGAALTVPTMIMKQMGKMDLADRYYKFIGQILKSNMQSHNLTTYHYIKFAFVYSFLNTHEQRQSDAESSVKYGLESGFLEHNTPVLGHWFNIQFQHGEALEKLVHYRKNKQNLLASADEFYNLKHLHDMIYKLSLQENASDQELEALADPLKSIKSAQVKTTYIASLAMFKMIMRREKRALQLINEIPADGIYGWYEDVNYRFMKAYLSGKKRKSVIKWLNKLASTQREWQIAYFLLKAKDSMDNAQWFEANRLFCLCIDLAEQSNRYLWAAFASEECGRMWLKSKDLYQAKLHIRKAYHQYNTWGSNLKAKQLDRSFADFQIASQPQKGGQASNSQIEDTAIDFQTALKTSRIISEAVETDVLLTKLMTAVTENAGAEWGCIVVPSNDDSLQFVVRAQSKPGGLIQALNVVLTEDAQDYLPPLDIIQYASRVNTPIIAGSYAEIQRFRRSRSQRNMKSLLVIPIISRAKIIAIIYLENRHLENAFSRNQLDFLTIISAQAAISLDNANLFAETKIKAKMEADLEMVRSIQNTLLARELPPEVIDVQTYYKPADQTGGDWFNHYYDDNSRVFYLFCGDVTGHGLSSALITGVAAGSVEAAIYGLENSKLNLSERLLHILHSTNNAIYNTGRHQDLFMTMVGIAIDLDSGRTAVLNAGQNPPALIGDSVRFLVSKGSVLGMSQSPEFRIIETELPIGASLFVYTDGLLENTGPKNEVLKERELSKILATPEQGSPELLDRVIQRCESIWQEHPASDDCTVISLKRREAHLERKRATG